MHRARRLRLAAGAALLLLGLDGLGGLGGLSELDGAARAQDTRLIAECGPAEVASTNPAPQTVKATCELRATDAVRFERVRANLKGEQREIETRFALFPDGARTLATLVLVQIMEPSRRADANEMNEAVIRLAEARDDNRRFAVYSVGNDLNLIADFTASKAEFERAVRAIRPLRVRTQLFKNTLDAVTRLGKQQADRKALIILGDGTSDDTPAGYSHEQVLRAAKASGVAIHALGYFADAADLPKFQNIRRLADDTGGFRREVRIGGAQRFAVTSEFTTDVLANGGTLNMTLKAPPGVALLALTADFANGRTAGAEASIAIPAAAAAAPGTLVVAPPEPQAWYRRSAQWLVANRTIAIALGLALALGLAGLGLFAFSTSERKAPAGPGAIYGWLDMLDGNASRYPLQTTNVRIGRHRDNDICLKNDSISRRHAVLHFNADNRRFVITDLGGNNGVIVNNIKQQSHELSDGDLVELGEVRLRFRSNVGRPS